VGTDATVSDNIRSKRLAMGLTQSDLAANMRLYGLEWTPNRVAQVETMRRRVRVIEAYGLCSILGMSLAELVSDD
jgi:transcriptional regulator with XRE-family HTH domain